MGPNRVAGFVRSYGSQTSTDVLEPLDPSAKNEKFSGRLSKEGTILGVWAKYSSFETLDPLSLRLITIRRQGAGEIAGCSKPPCGPPSIPTWLCFNWGCFCGCPCNRSPIN